MKVTTLLLALVMCSACGESTPPPAAKPAATTPAGPKTQKELDDLLKRADAAVPRNAPDNQPATSEEDSPVVFFDSPRTPATRRRSSGYSPAGYSPSGYSPSYQQPYDSRYPQPTEEEKAMQKAQYQFGGRISSLSSLKQNLTQMKMQKEYACTGKISTRPVNGDFGVNSPGLAQDSATSTQCRSATVQLAVTESNYKQRFDQLEIDAKRAGILPGTMRDLYTKYGFNPY